MKEEIKKILENKCDLIVQDRKVDDKSLRHWKLAGIIHSNNTDNVYGYWFNCSLKVILDSGNTMWAEKFQLALVSSNIYEEIMVLINPGELDFYALTDYEDIISLLETEFIQPYINSEKPSLSTTINNDSIDSIYVSKSFPPSNDNYYYTTWSSPSISTTINNDYLKNTVSTISSSIEGAITTSTINF